jgi:hypothetical protein
MRETPAAFASRTGAVYRPAPDLVAGARALAPDEPCPTLFRYPGPVALHAALVRTLDSLAPPGADVLWLAAHPLEVAPRAAAAFGALVILEPLRLSPCPAGEHYAARPALPDFVWVPPSRVAAGGAPWDGVATLAEARAVLGPGWEAERDRVSDELAAYLEEMAELRLRGAPPPPGAWCDVPAAERARLLAERGVAGRWTR